MENTQHLRGKTLYPKEGNIHWTMAINILLFKQDIYKLKNILQLHDLGAGLQPWLNIYLYGLNI